MAPAGYSGTPLPKKLGIRPRFRCTFPGAPKEFAQTLGALPGDVRVIDETWSGLKFVYRSKDRNKR